MAAHLNFSLLYPGQTLVHYTGNLNSNFSHPKLNSVSKIVWRPPLRPLSHLISSPLTYPLTSWDLFPVECGTCSPRRLFYLAWIVISFVWTKASQNMRKNVKYFLRCQHWVILYDKRKDDTHHGCFEYSWKSPRSNSINISPSHASWRFTYEAGNHESLWCGFAVSDPLEPKYWNGLLVNDDFI